MKRPAIATDQAELELQPDASQTKEKTKTKKSARPALMVTLKVERWLNTPRGIFEFFASPACNLSAGELRVFSFLLLNSWGWEKESVGSWKLGRRKDGSTYKYWEPMTQREIARGLGISIKQEGNVSRLLQDLKSNGLVAEKDGRLFPNPHPVPQKASKPAASDPEKLINFDKFPELDPLFSTLFLLRSKYEARKAVALQPLEDEYQTEARAVKSEIEEVIRERLPEGAEADQELIKVDKFLKLSPLNAKPELIKIDKKNLSNRPEAAPREAPEVADSKPLAGGHPRAFIEDKRRTEESSVGRVLVFSAAPQRPTEPTLRRPNFQPRKPLEIDHVRLIEESVDQFVDPFQLRDQAGNRYNIREDHAMTEKILRAGQLHGATTYQIAAYLYERLKYVTRSKRNGPESPGWFPAVVENHFREQQAAAAPPPASAPPPPAALPPGVELDREFSRGIASALFGAAKGF